MDFRKLVLGAIIVVSLVASAQPVEEPGTKAQKTTSTQETDTKSEAPVTQRTFTQKLLHGVNPKTWFDYLSQPKEYCTYAYSQAYGVCEGSKGGICPGAYSKAECQRLHK
jgi:hypothetical protein